MQLFQRTNWKGITQRLAIFFIAVVMIFAAYFADDVFAYTSILSRSVSFGLLYLGAMFVIVALKGGVIRTGIEMAMLFVLISETIIFGWYAWNHRDWTIAVFMALFATLYIVSVLIYRRKFILQKKEEILK